MKNRDRGIKRKGGKEGEWRMWRKESEEGLLFFLTWAPLVIFV